MEELNLPNIVILSRSMYQPMHREKDTGSILAIESKSEECKEGRASKGICEWGNSEYDFR